MLSRGSFVFVDIAALVLALAGCGGGGGSGSPTVCVSAPPTITRTFAAPPHGAVAVNGGTNGKIDAISASWDNNPQTMACSDAECGDPSLNPFEYVTSFGSPDMRQSEGAYYLLAASGGGSAFGAAAPSTQGDSL